MTFLRKKTINGKEYYYLVENRRIDGKVRQRVVRYIGSLQKLSQEMAKGGDHEKD